MHRAFPTRKSLTRRLVHKPLNHIRNFRNRIAHRKPIFKRDLCRTTRQFLKLPSGLHWKPLRGFVTIAEVANCYCSGMLIRRLSSDDRYRSLPISIQERWVFKGVQLAFEWNCSSNQAQCNEQVRTGASQNDLSSSSSLVSVTEHPCISKDVQ